MGEKYASQFLTAYCVAVLLMTWGVFSLSSFHENYDEKWYKEHSGMVTGFCVLMCLFLMGFYFKSAELENKTGFIHAKIILFIAILGYLFDWISLTNDITRFTEEETYNWVGSERKYITGQNGRTNSTLTGTAAMLSDVFVLYSSSQQLFGSDCSTCYHSKGYHGILSFLMICLSAWSYYLLNTYADNLDGMFLKLCFGLQVFLTLSGFVFFWKFPQKQAMIHIIFAAVGCLTIYILNGTESKLKLKDPTTSTPMPTPTPTPMPTAIRLDDPTRAPSSIIPILFYGKNVTRGKLNGLVIFINILLGWQNFWYAYVDSISSITTMLVLTRIFFTDLVVPSVLNYVNTSGQLKITSEDVKLPSVYDEDGYDENIKMITAILVCILVTILLVILFGIKSKIKATSKTASKVSESS